MRDRTVHSARIGIDLGGTKTEIVVLDRLDRQILRQRRPTPAGDYAQTVRTVAALVADAESAIGDRCSVGVGIPGSISPSTGLVRNANSTWLNGRPLDRDLEEAMQRPVRVANDANCFALSEAIDGAAAGARLVFGVILGTGVGGGIAVAGGLHEGANRIAGEWGHNPLPGADGDTAPSCWCGRRGCIETYLSGPAIGREHQRLTGTSLTAEEIVAAAPHDAAAADSLARLEQRLARALAMVVNVLDPDAIVLGGGLSNVRSLYAAVPRLWRRWIFSDDVGTRLLPPLHGDSSGVRGAARLWPVGKEA